LRDKSAVAEIRFGELGYAREARISYQDFLTARKSGQLPPHVRFQVSLPTPFAVINPFVSPEDALVVEGPYEAAMLREVDTICRAIPHGDLCIQWDVCIEMLLWDGRWEGRRDPFGGNLHREILSRLRRLAEAVPVGVELGFHLCYGDYDARHFIEPQDAGKLVEMANSIAGAVTRSISYVHMPVPVDRTDDAYFEPLSDLHLSTSTELYLGLVHLDGVEGTRKRIATAARYVSDFGIATECGMARLKTPEQVENLLRIHAAACQTPAATAM